MGKYILQAVSPTPGQVKSYLDGRRYDHLDPGSQMMLALCWRYVSSAQGEVTFVTESRYMPVIVHQLNKLLLRKMAQETGCHLSATILHHVLETGQMGQVQ